MITNTAGYRIPRATSDKVHGRSRKRCEGLVPTLTGPATIFIPCGNKPTAIHHCVTKGRGGHLLDRFTIYHLKHLCDACHRYAHSAGETSYDLGLLIDGSVTWDKVWDCPVYTGSNTFLTDTFPKVVK